MNHRSLPAGAFVVAAAFAIATAAWAQNLPTVMIVLDGSGSMWGKLKGDKEAKIELAQEYLAQSLAKSNPRVRLGFASFGHRRKGDCNDADVVSAPAPGNAEAVSREIAGISPRGRGPLVLALRKTAQVFGEGATGNIVLIHDGLDNCRLDPCAEAEVIAKQHPNIAIYVISVGLDAAEAKTMQCLAGKTSGKAVAVYDGVSFGKAVAEALTLVTLQPPVAARRGPPGQPLSETGDDTTKGPPALRASATLAPESETALAEIRWRVTKKGEPQTALVERQAAELITPLQPGTYVVEAKAGLAVKASTVDVDKDGTTTLRTDLGAGVLTFRSDSATPSRRDTEFDPTIYVLRSENAERGANKGEPLWIGYGISATDLIVPSGAYLINVESGGSVERRRVIIAPGQTTVVESGSNTGLLVLDTAEDRKGLPEITYIVSTDDPEAPGGRREVARSAAPRAEFSLRPGTYYARAKLGHAQLEQRIAVGAQEVINHAFQFDIARVMLTTLVGDTALPASKSILYKAISLIGELREVARSSRSGAELILPAGRYRFEAMVFPEKLIAVEEVSLAAGMSADVKLRLKAGRVELRAAQSGAPNVDGRVEIENEAGKLVWQGRIPTDNDALLPPGRYIVHIKDAGRAEERSLEIRAGETSVLDLDSG